MGGCVGGRMGGWTAGPVRSIAQAVEPLLSTVETEPTESA